MMMCSRCKKRPAVVFISTSNGSEHRSEGLCLKCAKELGLPQVNDYLKQMGISDEDFENAYDALFDENGNPDPEMLKNMGFADITNMKSSDDEDSDNDDYDGEEDKESLFHLGAAGNKP